jgi:acetolactate synthase-1/2/3 large subunit
MNTKPTTRNGAQLIAQQLESLGVRYIFGIPGAKIDRLFDAIEDTNIQMIPVRHEALRDPLIIFPMPSYA